MKRDGHRSRTRRGRSHERGGDFQGGERMKLRRGVQGLLLLAVVGGGPVMVGQNGNWSVPSSSQDRQLDPTRRQEPPDEGRVRMQEEQAKRVNDERQKRLVADTARLYELAGELKEQVGKSDKNTLSIDVVKKAEEIERLARSVKDKMRG